MKIGHGFNSKLLVYWRGTWILEWNQWKPGSWRRLRRLLVGTGDLGWTLEISSAAAGINQGHHDSCSWNKSNWNPIKIPWHSMTCYEIPWNQQRLSKVSSEKPYNLYSNLYIYYITLIYNYIFMLLAEIIYTQLLLKDFLRFDIFHGGCWEMHRCLAVKSTMFAPRIHLPCMYNFKIIPICSRQSICHEILRTFLIQSWGGGCGTWGPVLGLLQDGSACEWRTVGNPKIGASCLRTLGPNLHCSTCHSI
jgi:hypothetical protein